MAQESQEIAETSPLSSPAANTTKTPPIIFKDQASIFNYLKRSPAKLSTLGKPDTETPKSPLPALKRKRSEASVSNANSDRDVPLSSATEKTTRAPQRKSTLQNRRALAGTKTPATPLPSNLHDTLRANLTLVFIGLNPGIMTAEKGFPYAHPSNSFWRNLHTSGVTPVQHLPREYAQLPDLYGIGNTNICARPSRLGSELSKAELQEGAKILDDKIALYQPEAVCITGKGVWEAMWIFKTGKKKLTNKGEESFQYGWQDEKLWLGRTVDKTNKKVVWKGARTFVAPSTSGLNAGMSLAEKDDVWRPIGEWMKGKREERKKEEQQTRQNAEEGVTDEPDSS